MQAWSLQLPPLPAGQQQPGSATAAGSLSLAPRQVTLREHRSSTFVDVCLAPPQAGQPAGSCGVYALVQQGVLLLLRPSARSINVSINLQVRPAALLFACRVPQHRCGACQHHILLTLVNRGLPGLLTRRACCSGRRCRLHLGWRPRRSKLRPRAHRAWCACSRRGACCSGQRCRASLRVGRKLLQQVCGSSA